MFSSLEILPLLHNHGRDAVLLHGTETRKTTSRYCVIDSEQSQFLTYCYLSLLKHLTCISGRPADNTEHKVTSILFNKQFLSSRLSRGVVYLNKTSVYGATGAQIPYHSEITTTHCAVDKRNPVCCNHMLLFILLWPSSG